MQNLFIITNEHDDSNNPTLVATLRFNDIFVAINTADHFYHPSSYTAAGMLKAATAVEKSRPRFKTHPTVIYKEDFTINKSLYLFSSWDGFQHHYYIALSNSINSAVRLTISQIFNFCIFIKQHAVIK